MDSQRSSESQGTGTDPRQPGVSGVDLWRCRRQQGCERAEDLLAKEEPLEIRVQGRCIAVTMRTPGDDAELAAGFLLSEGLMRERAEVLELAHCQQGEAAH